MGACIPEMAAWIRCSACSGSSTPGARAMMAYWMEVSRPVGTNLGIYSCRPVAGSNVLSVHSCGRAVDLGVPVVNGGHPVAWAFIERFAPYAKRLGIQLVIFNRRVWSASRHPCSEPYLGVHPHRDHIHLELNPTAASNLTLATLRSVLGTEALIPAAPPPPPPTPQEDEMFLPLDYGDGLPGPREFKRSDVAFIQATINRVQGGPRLIENGHYNDEMVAAVKALGLSGTAETGRRFTGSMWGRLLDRVLAGVSGGGSGLQPGVTYSTVGTIKIT